MIMLNNNIRLTNVIIVITLLLYLR